MREQIMNAKLGLPSYQVFLERLGNHYANMADKMFQAMWFAYLKNKSSINLVFWSGRFNNPKAFNIVLKALSDANWIVSHSIPERNWAEAHLNEDKLLQFVTPDELESVRSHNKFIQYRLESTESTKTSATRLNGKTVDTGLTRIGFMKAGNTRFSYDTAYMHEYRHVIQPNLTKSMDKIAEFYPNIRHDHASYDAISVEILDWLEETNETFTSGDNYNDSRGRAISSVLSKVANPISNKDMRSLLEIPEGV